MTDPTCPTTADELAAVLGKSKRQIDRLATAGGWHYIEEASHSRYKKRLYTLKGLPKNVQATLYTYRYNQGVKNAHQETQQTQQTQPPAHGNRQTLPDQLAVAGLQRGADQPRAGTGHHTDRVPAHPAAQRRATPASVPAVMGRTAPKPPPQGSGEPRVRHAGVTDGGGIAGSGSAEGAGDTGLAKTAGADGQRLLAVDGKRTAGVHTQSVAAPALGYRAADESQRGVDGARQLLLHFANRHPAGVVEACADLTAGYADGSLSDELRQAIDDSNHRLTATRRGTVSARSLTRWQTQKKATGHCLPAKTRSKVSWDSAWWMPMLLACYRQPQKPKLTEAMQAFSDDWIRHGFNVADLPSYGIVDRLLKRMPPILRETGRSTGSELAALKPFIRRDWSGASNEVWVGDGHSFKAKVRHPRTGQAFAPEVTVIIDAASRFIVGWAFSLSENQIAVSEALGQGMLKHGKPLIYYSDNGSGQTAKTIDCPAGGMLARLGVTHETGRPGNPQGRGIIEGLWDITAIAAAKTFPTFQGTGMDSGALRKVTNLINSAKSKGEVPAFVPTWERFMATVEEYIDSYNHTHSHSSLGGKTPAEVYYAGFDATWSCPLTEDEALTLYRPFIIRTVVRGEVKWINNVYFNRELSELPLKTKVQVHYDLHHADKVWISDLAGKPICIALWDGNKRDGFAKSKRDLIRDVRIDGIVKLAEQKVAAALAEREDANIIEGEVLVRVPVPMVEPEAELVRVTAPVQPQEETLKRVPSPPTLPEEPLNTVLLEGKFNRQQPEEEAPMRTHAETAAWIDAMLEQRRQSQ